MQKKSLFFLGWVAAFLLALGATTASAQFNASLSGAVLDSTQAAIPGATVTLTNPETKITKTAKSGADGTYQFSELGPGSYTLSVVAKGFSVNTISNLMLAAETPRNLNLTLQTGSESQTVTVNADTLPLLQTADASIGSTINDEELQRLPVVGGNPYELLRTTPGVVGDGARASNGTAIFLPNGAGPGGSAKGIFQTEDQVQISANGQRVENNTYSVDGVTVDSLSHGGAAVVTPNQEAVSQLTVISSDYDAADGRNSGAQIKVVTKSGTNNIHGSLFFLYDEPGLNAYARYGGPDGQLPQRNDEKQRTYDASIGGPLLKNKLFGFASFSGFGLLQNAQESQFIETPQFDAAVIAQRPGSVSAAIAAAAGNSPRVLYALNNTCSLYNSGNNPAQFPCTAVAGGLDIGSLTPGGATQNGVYLTNGAPNGTTPAPSTVGGGLDGVPDIEYVQLAVPAHSRGRQFNGRLDYYLTQKDQIAGSFFITKLDGNGTSGSNGARPNEDIPFKPLNTAATLIYIHTFSPSWINELRGNGTRFEDKEVADGGGLINYGIPYINIQNDNVTNNINYGITGGSVSTPADFAENTFEVRDQATHTFGTHTVRFGGGVRFEQDNDNLYGNVRPSYAFVGMFNFANSAPVFEGIDASLLTGAAPDTQLYLRSKDIYGYLQHDWKVTPTFTLNTGFRYEIYTPLSNKTNNIGHAVLGPAGSELSGLKLVPQSQFYNTDYGHYGPKVGFAWVPDYFGGKIVIRGGGGISYDHLDAGLFENQAFDNAQGAFNYGLCCDFTAPGNNIKYELGTNNNPNSYPANPGLISAVNANGFPANGNTIELYGSVGTVRNPVVYLFSLENQIALPGKMSATIGYQGSISRHQPRLVNQNFLYNNTGTPTYAFYAAQTDSNADYNALNVSVAKPLSHGFIFNVNYTFSKSLDQISFGDGSDSNANQTDPADNKTEYGPSDYDSRNRVTASVNYTSPKIAASNGIVRALINGWQANAIATVHSSFPFTPVTYNLAANVVTNAAVVGPTRPLAYYGGAGASCSNDAFKSGSNFPNRVNGTNLNAGGVNYFNITAPTLPGGAPYIYTPGIGRNSFNGPCYRDVDLSAAKQITVPTYGENHADIRFQADLFNAFNLLQLSPIQNGNAGGGANINSNDFDKAPGADAGRVIDFSLRVNF